MSQATPQNVFTHGDLKAALRSRWLHIASLTCGFTVPVLLVLLLAPTPPVARDLCEAIVNEYRVVPVGALGLHGGGPCEMAHHSHAGLPLSYFQSAAYLTVTFDRLFLTSSSNRGQAQHSHTTFIALADSTTDKACHGSRAMSTKPLVRTH